MPFFNCFASYLVGEYVIFYFIPIFYYFSFFKMRKYLPIWCIVLLAYTDIFRDRYNILI